MPPVLGEVKAVNEVYSVERGQVDAAAAPEVRQGVGAVAGREYEGIGAGVVRARRARQAVGSPTPVVVIAAP